MHFKPLAALKRTVNMKIVVYERRRAKEALAR